MEKNEFLNRLNQLIEKGIELVNSSVPLKGYNPLDKDITHYIKCHSWRLSCLNLLRNYFGQEHHFYINFKSVGGWEKVIDKGITQPVEYCREDLAKAYAVLLHIKEEVNLGLISDAQHLYEANLFSNLLEQASELAEKGYLVASAVFTRLVIENFINDLCRIKGITTEEKEEIASKLVKLRKLGSIDLPQERMIQANYEIGTFAVHGNPTFNNYTKERIIELINDVKSKILIIN